MFELAKNLKTLQTVLRFEGLEVRAEGIEPPRLAALDPKSSTSTSSATPANEQPFVIRAAKLCLFFNYSKKCHLFFEFF